MTTASTDTFMGSIRTRKNTFANSSLLVSGEYDTIMEELILTFKGGERYRYPAVPPEVVEELFAAEELKVSPGMWFTQRIRPFFTGTRMEGVA